MLMLTLTLACLQVLSFHKSITNMMWAGIVPAGIAGWWAAFFRQRYFSVTVVNNFK